MKCRPVPSSLLPDPLSTEFRRRAVPSKSLDGCIVDLAARGHGQVSVSIRQRSGATFQGAFSLKQQRCPRCGCHETLNRHSILRGNHPSIQGKQSVRGQRVFCSNRGRRGGCGHTFSVFLADVLPRHTFTACVLWRWLAKMLSNISVKAATEQLLLPFTLESLYRVRRTLHRQLDVLRSQLCRQQSPPASAQSVPLLQTIEHLHAAFPGHPCPPAAFQLHFQRPFLG